MNFHTIRNFLNNFYSISAERTNLEKDIFLPTFYQHKKAYLFCQKFIKNKEILEIGCGLGYGSYILSKKAKKIIAIDKDLPSIKRSKNKYKNDNLNFIHSSIETYKATEKVDGIIALQLIEHLKRPELLLKRIKTFLKPNGFFLLSTPNKITQSYNENPYHYQEYGVKELFDRLSKYFKNVQIYGLQGDKQIQEYENQRKKNILSLISKDNLNLRKKIPRPIRIFLFDFFAFLNKRKIALNLKTISFSEKKFTISKKIDKSIDLIAICENLR